MNTLMYNPDGLGTFILLSKDGKDASYEGRNGWKSVYFPPESVFQLLMLFFARVLFLICTLTWRANNYVKRQEKV